MAATKRRYSKDEFARRGDQAYEAQVRPKLTADDDGKFAAIDIESGQFEIDSDELTACDKLNARLPDAQIWLVRVGSRFLHRFGGRGGPGWLAARAARGDRVRFEEALRRVPDVEPEPQDQLPPAVKP